MPAKNIMQHTEWTALKKKHGLANFTVSGVDVGKALDTYKTKYKALVAQAGPNSEAATALYDVLKKYIDKLPKDAKRPKAFDDAAKQLRDDAKENVETFKEQAKEAADFAHRLQRFREEVIRLSTTPDGSKLEEIEKNQLLPPLEASLKKLDLHDYVSAELVEFKKSVEEISRMKHSGNNMAALAEAPGLRILGEKIFQKLLTALRTA